MLCLWSLRMRILVCFVLANFGVLLVVRSWIGSETTKQIVTATPPVSNNFKSSSRSFPADAPIYPEGPNVPCEDDELRQVPEYDLSIVMVTRIDQYGGEESHQRMQRVMVR
jgi:hypothetical protein